jgi:hypothetical protein
VAKAQAAKVTVLTTTIGVWPVDVRARHKRRKIALTTAAVNATITTPRRTIDMIGLTFAPV